MPAAFSVDQRSTFVLPVEFHKPGSAEPVTIRYSCVHRKLSEVAEFEREMRESFNAFQNEENDETFAAFKARAEAQFVHKVANSWDAASDFDVAGLTELFDAYPSAYPAFMKAYSDELMGLREK